MESSLDKPGRKKEKKAWNGPVYLTVDNLSQMLQVSPVRVYKLVRQKRIPFYHIERCVRFSQPEIMSWIEERKCRELRMPRRLKKAT